MRLNLLALLIFAGTVFQNIVTIACATELEQGNKLLAEGKKLKAPIVKRPAGFNSEKLKQEFTEFLGELTETPGIQADLNFVKEILLESKFTELVLLGLTADRKADQDNDQDILQSLLSIRQSKNQDKLSFISREHAAMVHVLPEVKISTWSSLRAQNGEIKAIEGAFAGHSLYEYCAADAGKGAPRNASMNISLLDMAMAESTKNRFELSLLHFLDQPDVFSKQIIQNVAEDSLADEQPWQAFFRQFSLAQKKASHKIIADFKNSTATQNLTPSPAEDLQRNLSEKFVAYSAKMSAICKTISGKWIQPARDDKRLENKLFECSGAKSGGFKLVTEEDPEFPEEMSVALTVTTGYLVGTIRVDSRTTAGFPIEMEVVQKGGLGSEQLYFDHAGNSRAHVSNRSVSDAYLWANDGQLAWSGQFKSNGAWINDTTWSSSGSAMARFIFSNNGELQELVEWYEGGQPARQLHFFRNKPDGLEKWWHPTGLAAGEINWYAGKKFGAGRLYFENGMEAFNGSYVDDQLEGLLKWRDHNGREVFVSQFKSGNPDGPLKIFNSDGLVLADASFDLGRVEGTVTIGVAGNRSGAKLRFVSGVLDGESVFYAADGSEKVVVPYRSGKINGELRGYFRPGQEAMRCKFESGRLLEWSVNSSKRDDILFDMRGKVFGLEEKSAELNIKIPSKDLTASCFSNRDTWSECKWNIAGSLQSLDMKLPSSLKAVKRGREKRGRSCQQIVKNWDLSPIVDRNQNYVFVSTSSSKYCDKSVVFTCKVGFEKSMTVNSCVALTEEHSHNHE